MGKGVINEVVGAAEIAAGAALLATGVGGALGVSLIIQGAASEIAGIAESLASDRNPGVTTRAAAAPRRIIYGTQRVGGVVVYESTTGDHLQHFNQIIVLATHPCESIENLYLDGRQVIWPSNQTLMQACSGNGSFADTGTYTGSDGHHYSFGSEVYLQVHMGAETAATVNNYGINNGGVGADSSWPSNAYGGGCTWVYLRITHDTNTFPSYPEVRFTIRGKNDIYDPRTQAVGYTSNWALCVGDMIGRCPSDSRPHSKWSIGDVVNEDQLIAAANVCDQAMTCATGTENNYELHYNYDTTLAPADAVDKAMQEHGRISNIGGEWYIWPAYWQGPSFTLDSSVLVDAVQWNPKRSIADLCNRVQGTYIAPNYPYNPVGNYYDAHGWYDGTVQNNFQYGFQPTSFPPYACDQQHGYGQGVDVYLSQDGGVYLPKNINLETCLSISQAQRIAKIVLLRNRQQGQGVLRMNLTGLQLQPCDVIQFNFSQIGWLNKTLEVTSVTLKYGSIGGEQGEQQTNGYYVEVGVQETAPSVYEWNPAVDGDELDPYDVPVFTPNPGAVPAPTNLTVQDSPSTAIVDSNGATNPAMLVQWTPPLDARVNNGGHIEVQYQFVSPTASSPINGVALTQQPNGTYLSAWIDAGKYSGQATYALIEGVPETVTVNVHIRAVRTNGQYSDWVSATMSHTLTQLGIPLPLTDVYASEEPYNNNGTMMSVVAVQFAVPQVNGAQDPNFDHAEVYFTGYQGNSNPQLMAQGYTSPIELLCQSTGETVTITVVSASGQSQYSDWSSSPTCTVVLNGVATPPTAPSLYAAQTALPGNTGWQFTINVISNYERQLIQGYRVYHADTNNTGTVPTLYTFYPQPATGGQLTVTETTADIMWYWVTSVNTAGEETPIANALAVAFNYQDPNATAPAALPSVQTTKDYSPVVLLNGWAANAQAGNYESGGGLGSEVWGTNGSATQAYSIPTNASDANEGTCATARFAHTHQYAGCIWSFSNWSGLPSGASVVSAQIKVLSEIVATSGPVHGHADIWTSVDGGNTWTKLYATYNTKTRAWDTVPLPAGQDFTKVQVMAFTDSHDDIQHNVYEVQLEVVQSAPAGPQPVTGVTATLDTATNNVKLTWNGLTPTNRTDIISYEVTRGVVGSDYAHSHTQTTIPFVSGQATYSWEDPQAHDGSFIYWVIANNSTSWSTPSAPAGLSGASSLVYSNGQTVEALRPAQAGATLGATLGSNLKDSQGVVLTEGAYKNNIVDASWWAPGAASPWPMNQQSDTSQTFVPASFPDGSSRIVWQAVAGPSGNAQGGWDAGGSGNWFAVSPSKTYLFACYVRRTSGGGTAYWGPNGNTVCALNTTTAQGNPYFVSASLPQNGRWYLMIGWVYPSGSTGLSNSQAGLWDCVTGQQVAGGNSFCWNSSTAVAGTRAYQYYTGNGTQQFAAPGVFLCDGHEPSLDSLLAFSATSARNPISGNNYSTYIQSGAIPLDHIGDGATYLRMPGSNLDGNRRALIDFSSSHLNNTLDHVRDGGSYKRVTSSTGIQRFKIAAQGLSATYGGSGLWLNGTYIASSYRSYNLVVYNRSNMQQSYASSYDVYGSPNNATNLASYLNGLNNSYIIFLWTYDEPQNNRLSGGLPAAIQRCGGSAVFTSPNFRGRSAYLLVGIPGMGTGNGIEMYAGDTDSSSSAFCETSVLVIDGELNGSSSSVPSNLIGPNGAAADGLGNLNLKNRTSLPTQPNSNALSSSMNGVSGLSGFSLTLHGNPLFVTANVQFQAQASASTGYVSGFSGPTLPSYTTNPSGFTLPSFSSSASSGSAALSVGWNTSGSYPSITYDPFVQIANQGSGYTSPPTITLTCTANPSNYPGISVGQQWTYSTSLTMQGGTTQGGVVTAQIQLSNDNGVIPAQVIGSTAQATTDANGYATVSLQGMSAQVPAGGAYRVGVFAQTNSPNPVVATAGAINVVELG